MKKLSGIILAGAMALSIGTQAFAADTNKGNHYGWEKGTNNPHKSEVKPPEVEVENPTVDTVSLEEINAIVNDINKASIENTNAYGFGNARYENGWIKIDNIQFSPWALYNIQMKVIYDILDQHNVQRTAYAAENVVWDCPDAMCTSHWGTVGIKVDKK
jgi:hypothetical protein